MLNKFLAATALTLSLSATGALAQTGSVPPADTGTTTTGTQTTTEMTTQTEMGMPTEWDGTIGEAFFSDADTGTLRSDDEIRANWGTMSEADRISVQNYCARVGLEQTGAATGIAADDADDQRAQTEQMGGAGAAAGQAAGVTTTQAEDQQAETEQMDDAGAAAGQAAGVPSDQAEDQRGETEQMGDPGMYAASIDRVCDMIETM